MTKGVEEEEQEQTSYNLEQENLFEFLARLNYLTVVQLPPISELELSDKSQYDDLIRKLQCTVEVLQSYKSTAAVTH